MPEIVLVTGASGFIGRIVVYTLLKSGCQVKAFVRSRSASFPDHPNFTQCIGDVRDVGSLEAAMGGVTAVVHLAAAKNDERESEAINIGGAKNVIEACRIAGVKRVVNISTQSAKLTHPGLYGATKAEADRLFHASGLPVVTLRCSLIYATEMSGVFGTIVRYSSLPFIPVFGKGEAMYRPMHRDDLALVIAQALEAPDVTGQMIDVGGPDTLTFNAVIRRILEARDVRRPILHLPLLLGLTVADLLLFLPKPPITISNVLGGSENVPMDMEPFQRIFWTVPVRSFDQGLTELFGPIPDRREREARMLLTYVLSSVGDWTPDASQIALFRKALAAHSLDHQILDERILRSRWSLSRYDTASRIIAPHSLLQKKLLVAAAIAEVQPTSAEALLPRDRSMVFVILRALDLTVSAALKILLSLPLLLLAHRSLGEGGTPQRLKHHAGV